MNYKYITYLLIIFFFILFIGGNAIIVIGYNTSLKEISDKVSLNTKVSAYKSYTSEAEVKYINISNTFSASGKAIILENLNFKIYSINSISGIYSESSLDIESEYIYIKTINPFYLKFANTLVTLNTNSIVLINDNNIYVLDGSIKFDNTVVSTANQLSNISNQLSVYKTDRSIFEDEKYSELLDMLKNFELYSEYFTDFTQPELLSLTPRNEFKTTESYLNISGTTEENITVILNDQTSTTRENGEFNFRIELSLGDNLYKLTLRDKYLNESITNLTYNRLKVTLTPISNIVSYPSSYPASFPVSYSN